MTQNCYHYVFSHIIDSLCGQDLEPRVEKIGRDLLLLLDASDQELSALVTEFEDEQVRLCVNTYL